VLHEAAVIVILKRLPRLVHRGLGQQHRLAPRPIILAPSLADDHGMQGVGLAVATVGLTPVLRRARRIIGGQPRDPPTSVSRRAVRAVWPGPWRLVCARRPTVISSPAAAWARASAVTAHELHMSQPYISR
jgi:hypothetical protein